jgi:hypothetical protein
MIRGDQLWRYATVFTSYLLRKHDLGGHPRASIPAKIDESAPEK